LPSRAGGQTALEALPICEAIVITALR